MSNSTSPSTPSPAWEQEAHDRIWSSVLGGLKGAVKAHGPLTAARLNSATKRVVGLVLVFFKEQREKERRDWMEAVQQLANKIAELDDARSALMKELEEANDAAAGFKMHNDHLRSEVAARAADASQIQEKERLEELRDFWLFEFFRSGIKTARAYGDNAFHLEGAQLQRQFERALKTHGFDGTEYAPHPAEAQVAALSAQVNELKARLAVLEPEVGIDIGGTI